TQDICVFRDDVGGRLRRNAIRLREKPDDEDDEMEVDNEEERQEAAKKKEVADTLINAKKVSFKLVLGSFLALLIISRLPKRSSIKPPSHPLHPQSGLSSGTMRI